MNGQLPRRTMISDRRVRSGLASALAVMLVLSGLGARKPPRAAAGEAADAAGGGTVTAWGPNTFATGLTGVRAISTGEHHSLALKSDGTVAAWGDEAWVDGQMAAPAGLTGVTAIAAGITYSLALKGDGTVTAWGADWSGALSVPQDLTGVTAIAAGDQYSLALKGDGTVTAWGRDDYGEASVPPDLTGVIAIAAGQDHSLAVRDDGTVVAWGSDEYSEASVPEDLAGVIAVAAGSEFSMALKSDGTVITWGLWATVPELNGYGRPRPWGWQLKVPDGLTDVVAIAAGRMHALALKRDGTVVQWGSSNAPPQSLAGVAAVAAAGSRSLALKGDGTLVPWGQLGDFSEFGQAIVPTGLTDVTAVAAGNAHSVALKRDGTLIAWGDNTYGQLDIPPGLTGVVAIAAASDYTLALKRDGTVVAWGNCTAYYHPTVGVIWPVVVPDDLGGVVAIAAGHFYSLALKANGTVTGWDQGWYDSFEVPVISSRVTAIAAGGAHALALMANGTVVSWGSDTFVPAELVDVVAIAAGEVHSLALTQDGTVTAWYNADIDYHWDYYGQAVVPAGLTDVIAIAAGSWHSLALKADGTVVAWGRNDQGQLTVPEGLTNVTAIAGGSGHSLAVSGAPDAAELSVSSVSTTRGGNMGNATVTISGKGFHAEATAKLIRPGQPDITGTNATVTHFGPNLSRLRTTFDLNNRPEGEWAVVVENPDGRSAVLPEPFMIVPGRQPRVTWDIVGPSSVRFGGAATYYVVVRNEGTNDVEVTTHVDCTPLLIGSPDIGSTQAAVAGELDGAKAAVTGANSISDVVIDNVIEVGMAVAIVIVSTQAWWALPTAVFIRLVVKGLIAAAITAAIKKLVRIVRSSDPNDAVGPGGYGDERFVREELLLPYTVFFENKPDATAPAQDVVITDQLDPAEVDLDTFALRGITFGDRQLVPPDGVSEYSTVVDLRPSQALLVRVSAKLDRDTGLVTWRFASIDPDTGLPPTDPMAGFLPPNVTPPEGEGSVSFTVEPKKGLASGTVIRNGARIVFDTNDPIDTPEWFNTLDNTDPSSQVLAPPATQELPTINVQWSGADTGSGVDDYTLYISEDGGPYKVWLPNTTETSASFTGQVGKAYRFFSSARDGAGNVEALPNDPDAMTRILQPTPPVITPTVVGTTGANGWYTGDMTVSWAVTDPESAVTSTHGCDPTTITADTNATLLTCSATSGGGTTDQSLTIKRDATAPTSTWDGEAWADGAEYAFGAVPAPATCTAQDATSGMSPAGCVVTGYYVGVGGHQLTATATDNAGNTSTQMLDYTVTAAPSESQSATPPEAGNAAVTAAPSESQSATPPEAGNAAVTAAPSQSQSATPPEAGNAGLTVRAVKGKGKLFVDVDPDRGKGYWSFKVQYRKHNGNWGTFKKAYRTKGNHETGTLNFKKGIYRVLLKSQHGFPATTSVEVALRR